MGQSPKQELVKYDFPEIMRKLIDGNKITKLEWNNKNIYGVLNEGILMLHKEDGKFYKWIINEGDILGTDWITV